MDEQYCQERNRFIPYAVAYANQQHGNRYPAGCNARQREDWYIAWNHTYFAEMDRLWREWTDRTKPNLERLSAEARATAVCKWTVDQLMEIRAGLRKGSACS